MSANVVPARSLAECEQVIERGLAVFTEVGLALVEIRDARLYRQSHGTFEEYCQERWGFSRVRAHQIIEASETTKALTIVNSPLPANEGQARELTGLPTEKAAEVMSEAAATGKVTAGSIREARERVAPRPESERHLRPVPLPPVFADPRVIATQLLDRICLLAEAPNSQRREHAAAWARQINTSDSTLPRLDAAIHYLTLLREELTQ